MKILIKNATLISMNEEREKIEKNVDIEITDNKITKIAKNIESDSEEKVIDATGKIVMPGLINTHSHVPMSIFRETLDGYNLQDWLEKKIWPMEDKLTESDIYYGSKLSFIEMIKTGCTTINDMYFMTDDIINAAIDTGIRLQTTRTLMNMNEEDGIQRLKELDELLEKYRNKNELITFNAGIHGLYTTNLQYVEKCIEFAKEKELLVHMHFCENFTLIGNDIPENVKNINYGKAKKIVHRKALELKKEPKKLSKEDIKRLSKLNISVSHCPVSNLKLGCGIANINEMIENNINVSLGTDGQGSGSNLDLFETMKFTALLQKGIQENAVSMPAYEVLKMATINGAKALNLEDKIGSLQEGKIADIIILNLNDVVTNPVNDIVSDIVYNAKGTNVETTIINGNILMESRKIKKDEKEVFEKCRKIMERIRE